MWARNKSGFTIVELLIVVVVIAILAAITIVSYNGIQSRALTDSSLATADQVRKKAEAWNTLMGSYPNLAQLRTNSVDPADIDNPGGADGPIEAKLSSMDATMGASIDEVRANKGKTVYYEPCGAYPHFSGAMIDYWNYTTKAGVQIRVGTCP